MVWKKHKHVNGNSSCCLIRISVGSSPESAVQRIVTNIDVQIHNSIFPHFSVLSVLIVSL